MVGSQATPAGAGVSGPASPASRHVTGAAWGGSAVPASVQGRAHGAPGTVTGQVRDLAGRALSRICVTASTRGRSQSALTTPDGRFLIAGLAPGAYALTYSDCGVGTSRQGGYSFAGIGLRPGKYLVMFTRGCRNTGNYAPQFWKRSPTPAKATVLHLRSGQHVRHIDAWLGTGGSLSGTVRSKSSGQRLAGICVFITSVTQPDCTSSEL